ncbi:unnamed protein product [Triticum turgidum subsp. durum]|uniref:Uncharacterized protein n=1 Tax=Triticum turgidum subsp. durum TaxID=4567 RepID=A0A9R1NS50_TRITD|nr:unnamed protein product [Triticum turgidum subsp. durum]
MVVVHAPMVRVGRGTRGIDDSRTRRTEVSVAVMILRRSTGSGLEELAALGLGKADIRPRGPHANSEGEEAALGAVDVGVLATLLILLDAESCGGGACSCREATTRIGKADEDLARQSSPVKQQGRRAARGTTMRMRGRGAAQGGDLLVVADGGGWRWATGAGGGRTGHGGDGLVVASWFCGIHGSCGCAGAGGRRRRGRDMRRRGCVAMGIGIPLLVALRGEGGSERREEREEEGGWRRYGREMGIEGEMG